MALVLILDFELCLRVTAFLGRGTHALGLARRKVASENAAVGSAGVINPFFGLSGVVRPAHITEEAASQSSFCVDGCEYSKSDGGGDLHGGCWGEE